MVSKNYQEQVAEAQKVRDRLLGKNRFSGDEINLVDGFLAKLLSQPDIDKLIVDPIQEHPYLKLGLGFSYGWYSAGAIFENPESILPRASKCRLVLFREYFMLSQIIADPWEILNQVSDISGLQEYAESGCRSLNLDSAQYFLHSSHCSRFLPKDEYDKIDKDLYAAILYPMYEGEVISAIVTIVATILGVEYARLRKKLRDKRNIKIEKRIDKLEAIIKRQNQIIAQMLLEMEIRNIKLLKLIDSNNGTIKAAKLKEIYLESYLPCIEMLRNSKGSKCPKELLSAQKYAIEYANKITRALCEDKKQNEVKREPRRPAE
jgi:hypothetical protein